MQVIGVLAAGGDSPGLNAAIRAIGKTAIRDHGMRVIGFRDGFRGLAQNRTLELDEHVQRGGIPSPGDRLLATRLGAVVPDLVVAEHFGVMVAARGPGVEAVPLEDVAGKRKTVPPDHPWIQTCRSLGISLGV